jgi:vacuolar protein sorting-associated protein 26
MSFFGFGGSAPKLQISIRPNYSRIEAGGVKQLDHAITWKVRKNPFSALKNFKQDQIGNADINDSSTVVSDITSLTLGGVDLERNDENSALYVYHASEDVEGVVNIYLPPGKKSDHLGIKVQFIGRIEMTQAVSDGRPNYDFISLSKELAPPGVLRQNKTTLPFSFKNVEKDYESYRGRNVNVHYFVRVLLERKFFPTIQKEQDVMVQILGVEPRVNNPIKMEVGIEECLHIEFEYERKHYHLNDVIMGKINFLLVRIRIKHMELAVIRRETSGEGVALTGHGLSAESGERGNVTAENQTLIKYEIMDGAPVKGETIPVRLYLKGIPADLTPTYDAGNNRFSVRYFLNLVLVDEEDRRYFKQQEILLWRKVLG